jgi:hypothetical protein
MTEIDRRTLITVAGAGLVLAGCGSHGAENSSGTPKQDADSADIFGTGYLHGQSVRAKRPCDADGNPVGNATFAPDRICVVLLRFETGGQMTARRLYIPMPQQSMDLTKVVWGALAKLSEPKPVDQYYRDHIDPIALGGQRLLVIYLDNDPGMIRFKHDRDPVPENEEPSYAYTLRFAPYSGLDPKDDTKPNHAFFNVKKMTFQDVSETKANTAFVLEYWNTNQDGMVIKYVDPDDAHTQFRYSLNILLESKAPSAKGDKWVPVIVDPDTGNMGAEP